MNTDVLNIDEQAIRADERDRINRIESTCAGPSGGWGANQARVDELKAAALAGDISEKDMTAQMLNILRESRPKLSAAIATDDEAVEAAVQQLAQAVAATNSGTADAERIAREIAQINDMVAALTMNLDPANLAMLNERLTQLRLRKESLEEELRMAKRVTASHDIGDLRKWAHAQLAGLRAAMDGERNDRTREVIATYVDRIVVWPSQKRGEMVLNAAAKPLWKDHGRSEERSWSNAIGATGFEPATSASRTQRSSQAEPRPGWVRRGPSTAQTRDRPPIVEARRAAVNRGGSPARDGAGRRAETHPKGDPAFHEWNAGSLPVRSSLEQALNRIS